MKTNVGAVDCRVRVVVGLALIAMVLAGPQSAWGWVGLAPLLTALLGKCPFYRLLNISTAHEGPARHPNPRQVA